MKCIYSISITAVFIASIFCIAQETPLAAKQQTAGNCERIKIVQGVIDSVNQSCGSITVKSWKGEESFIVSEQTAISIGIKESITRNDLRTGDGVAVFYCQESGNKIALKIYKIIPAPMQAPAAGVADTGVIGK